MVMAIDFYNLGSILLAILAAVLLLVSAWGAGGILVAVVRLQNVRVLDLALLRIVVGLNLVALAGVGLGQLGFLAGGRSLWLLAGCSLLAMTGDRIFRARPNVVELRQAIAAFEFRRCPLSLAFAVLAVGITLGPALAFPAGWDELVYHAVLPQRWHADGWPAVYSDLPFSAFPSLCEVLFWLVAPIESLIVSRLLMWVCWMLSLLILFRLLRRQVDGAASVILATAFMLGSATLMISANCYVESFQMLNVAAILMAVGLKSNGSGTSADRAPSILLGVLAGGAAAVKLTGLTVLLLPCVWYIGVAWRGRSTGQTTLRRLGVYGLVAGCVVVPFYWRAFAATGNPFYPYFDEWFSGDAARQAMSRFHHDLGGSFFGVRSVETLFTTPILQAFNEQLYDGSFGWQSLLILFLSAVAMSSALRSRVCQLAVWPAVVAVVLYLFWFLTAQQARFAAPLMLASVVVASFGLRVLHARLRRWVLVGLLVTTLASLPWKTAGYYFGSWETVLGFWTWTEYVDDGTDQRYVPLVRAIREQTPADARLLLLIEQRGLYLPRTSVIGTPFFQAAIFTPPENFATSPRVLEVLGRNRITHLVIAKSAVGPDRAPVWWERMAPLLQGIDACEREGRLRVVWESEQHVIFVVRSPSSSDIRE